MTDCSVYGQYKKLVEIIILGKKFRVPENNTCLRAFQFISPATVPYGRFCWNQECQLCRIAHRMPGDPDAPARPVLACKVLVAEGMQILELSEEIRLALRTLLNRADP
jgi:hypothetical protein